MKKINLCYTPDNNYAIPCSISIFSILYNLENDINVDIFILDGTLTESSKNKISCIVRLFDNANVFFIKVNDNEYIDFYTPGWKTSAAYRIKIGSILKNIDKILYLDCDIIAQKSIYQLYITDIQNNTIAMAPDIWTTKQSLRLNEKGNEYFNSGVALINLKRWREFYISEKIIDYFNKNRKKIIFPDQDSINAVFVNEVYRLDYKYNWCWHWEKNEAFEKYGEVKIKDAVLIHYIFSKPWWSCNFHIASKLYYDMIDLIPKKIRDQYKKFKQKKAIEKYNIYFKYPIFTKINFFSEIYYMLFNIIPILKCKIEKNRIKYYLFCIFPVVNKKSSINFIEINTKIIKNSMRY